MAERSSSLRLPRGGGIRLPHNTTSAPLCRGTFGLGCAPFPRRYSGHLILISLPPPTEMLQFGGFPLLIGAPVKGGIAIRGSPDLSPHAAPRGLWQLATPFIGARAEPSTRRLSSNGQGSLAHQALIGISLALTRISEICGIIVRVGMSPLWEVIQPQVPLRLPCYDLPPLAEPRLDSSSFGAGTLPQLHSGELTGGVYKGQGRIHRGMENRGY